MELHDTNTVPEQAASEGSTDFLTEPAQEQTEHAVQETAAAVEYPETYNPDEVAAGAEFDINALDAQTEELPPVDEEKLEDRMAYAPSLPPGSTHTFIFKLEETDPFKSITMKEKPVLMVRYNATLLRDDGSTGKTIRFLSANHFRSGKMESSRVEELLFALGLLKDYNQSDRKPSTICNLLQQAHGEMRTFRGVIKWERTLKDESTNPPTYHRWSTAPQKGYKKGDGTEVPAENPWPKGADGKFDPRPDDFAGNYGSETLSRVLPTKETMDALKANKGK